MTSHTVHTVQLPREIEEEIIAHSREGAPEEICGILRGREMAAQRLYRARNVAEERIENYTVDPETLLLQFEFEDAGDSMMGIYHSHPVSVAWPSATDAWNAHYPDSIYLICSLEFPAAPVIRAYRMTPHFLELDLADLRRRLNFYETRPGLFAFYQPADEPLPAVLTDIAGQIQAPFYIVCYVDAEQESTPDGHIVTIVELPIQVTG